MSQADDDKILGKAYDSRLIKRLMPYIAPYRTLMLLAIVMLLLGSAAQVAGPYLVKIGIDNYIAQGNLAGLHRVAFLYLLALVCQFLLQFGESYLTQSIGQQVMFGLRRDLFGHLQQLSLGFFDKNPVGRLITRVTSDVDALNEMVTAGMVSIFGNIFTIAGIVTVMLWLNWKLALVTFAVLPVLFGAAFFFKLRVRDTFRQVRSTLAVINSYLQENITGMRIVQLFNRERENFRRFDQINHDHLQANIDTVFYFSLFFPAVRFLSTLAVALIIWYGGGQILQGLMTFGVLVAFIQYADLFYRPIQDLSEKYNIFQSAMASAERVITVLDTKPIIQDAPQPKSIAAFRGQIEFKNVWFAYDDENYVLKDVSFTIKKGESVALVGATGSGKTTIVSLLCRFYDVNKGQILIDGIDIRDLAQQNLRQLTAIVLQDVFLFSGTIEDNIRLGNTDFSDERVRNAARRAHADPFINRLEKGYRQDVRERGATLSVGQKQLLSFARALAFNPQILVLDEATSNIDTETELLIQDALNALLEDRTSLVIAHRLSTIKHVNKIIVLHKGIVREAGSHDELLAHRGIYYKLYQLQYKDQTITPQAYSR